MYGSQYLPAAADIKASQELTKFKQRTGAAKVLPKSN
jgi:hypothetical protein